MPDTGAPWNIPYVENADLVSDWPADSLLVANAVAAGLSAADNAGIGSNVVNVIKADVFTTSSSSFVDVTGLTVTITPTTATSKILVIVSVSGKSSDVAGSGVAGFVLVRDSTQIAVGTGAVAGQFTGQLSGRALAATDTTLNSAAAVLDSPATTSAVVYKVQVRTGAGSIVINQDNGLQSSSVSTITAIEVAV